MKIGDYVRTKEYIRKIRKIEQDYIYCDIGVFKENEIIKSSPRIIDLIEVGDYVNGYYVEDITSIYDNEEEIKTLHLASGSNYFQPDINDKQDIKSIVTKEQFESMEYRIGE